MSVVKLQFEYRLRLALILFLSDLRLSPKLGIGRRERRSARAEAKPF
jgi:hypothetical protein